MNVATQIGSFSLLAHPPTWGNGFDMALEIAQPEGSNAPTASYASLPSPPTAIARSHVPTRYVAFESTAEARRASIQRLQNKIVELRTSFPPDANDAEGDQIKLAAEITANLVSEIPENLPLPKAMPLSSQISLYWEFGGTYAELAVSGNGQISLYGRRPGRPDVLVDTSFAELRKSGLTFPPDLDKILIPS